MTNKGLLIGAVAGVTGTAIILIIIAAATVLEDEVATESVTAEQPADTNEPRTDTNPQPDTKSLRVHSRRPSRSDDQSGFKTFVFLVVCLILYFLPSMIARCRNHCNELSINIINLFFGWTLLGWVVCLAWSFSYQPGEEETEATTNG